MNYFRMLLAASTIALTSASANAADFDGSKTMLCALSEAAECSRGKGCASETVDSINLPSLVEVNAKQNTITSKDPTRPVTEADPENNLPATGKATIKRQESMSGLLVLQGVDNGRAWSMAINQDTGRMTVSATSDGTGFVIQGACTIP